MLGLGLGMLFLINIAIWKENKQCEMGWEPDGPFWSFLMTPKGRGVVTVKGDQKGCGASKSHPFSEEDIFVNPAQHPH